MAQSPAALPPRGPRRLSTVGEDPLAWSQKRRGTITEAEGVEPPSPCGLGPRPPSAALRARRRSRVGLESSGKQVNLAEASCTLASLPTSMLAREDTAATESELPSDVPALQALARELRQRLSATVEMGQKLLGEIEVLRAEAHKHEAEFEELLQLYDDAASQNTQDVLQQNKQHVRTIRDLKAQVNQLQYQLAQLKQDLEDEKQIAEAEANKLREKEEALQDDKRWVEQQAVLAYEAAERAEAATDFEKLVAVMGEVQVKALLGRYYQKLRRWRQENNKRRRAIHILLWNGSEYMRWEQERTLEVWARLKRLWKIRSEQKALQRQKLEWRMLLERQRLTEDVLSGHCDALVEAVRRAIWGWDAAERQARETRRAAAEAARDAAETQELLLRESADEKAVIEDHWRKALAAAKDELQRKQAAAAQRQQQLEAKLREVDGAIRAEHELRVAELLRAQDAERAERAEWEARLRGEHAAALAACRGESAAAEQAWAEQLAAERARGEAAAAELRRALLLEAEQQQQQAAAELARARAAAEQLAQELAAAKRVHTAQIRDGRAQQDARRRRELREAAEHHELACSEQAGRLGLACSADAALAWRCLLHWEEAAAMWRHCLDREQAAARERRTAAADHRAAVREAVEQRQSCEERMLRERASAADSAASALAALRARDAALADAQQLRRQLRELQRRNAELDQSAKAREQEAALARHALMLVRAAAAERRQQGGDADLTGALRRVVDLAQNLRLQAAQTQEALRSPTRFASPSSNGSLRRGLEAASRSPGAATAAMTGASVLSGRGTGTAEGSECGSRRRAPSRDGAGVDSDSRGSHRPPPSPRAPLPLPGRDPRGGPSDSRQRSAAPPPGGPGPPLEQDAPTPQGEPAAPEPRGPDPLTPEPPRPPPQPHPPPLPQ